MKDRLEELKKGMNHDSEDDNDDVIIVVSTEDNDDMTSFFNLVEEVRGYLNKIALNIVEVKAKHSKLLSSPQADEATEEELSSCMEDIKDTAKRARVKLQAIEQTTSQNTNEYSHTVLRIRKTQHSGLSRKFTSLMFEYNQVQSEYRDNLKTRIRRQLVIVGRNVTDDELEDMLDHSKGNVDIFTHDIVIDKRLTKQALNDIKTRHHDIITLENNILELHDLFLNLYVLVEEQGDIVDRIEYNVKQASYDVEKSVSETRKAVRYQSQHRRTKIICFSVLCIILLAIVGLVVGIVLSSN